MSKTKIVLNEQSNLILTGAAITAPIGIIKGDIPGLTGDLSDLSAADSAESLARIAGDASESARALAAEALIQADLDGEVSRIDSRDLATEVRIYNVEGSVSAEIANRIADVNAEETRALAAEAGLQADVDAVTANVDAILLASDADKDSFAEIVTLINSVDTTNDDAFAGYVLLANAAASAEEAARIAGDAGLQSNINAEATLRSSATYQNYLDIVAEKDLRIAALAAEETRAIAAEAGLQADVDALDAAAIKTASNGLTETDNNVKLGGALTGNTDVTGEGLYTLNLGTETSRLSVFNNYVTGQHTINANGFTIRGNAGIDAWTYAGNISNIAQNGKVVTRSQSGTENSSANFISTISDSGNIINTANSGAILNTASGAITDSSLSRSITTTGGLGAVYGADYSAGFVDNSLVSKLYVTNQIAAEATLARTAEAGLQADVDAVTANVDAILLAADADKNSFAEIVGIINSVNTTNDEAFAGYVLSNNAAVAAESAARSAADVAETLRATAVENTKISTVDATAFNTRALLAEDLLSGRITAEVDRATLAEAGLDGRIVNIISNIDVSAIDSFSETVSKVNTAFSSTSSSLSANTISNRPSMKGFNEAPNGERVLFTSSVVLDTQIVFLNGLMQVSGAENDYTVTSNPMTGILMVTFLSAPALSDKVNIYGVTSGIAIPAPSVVAA